MQCSKQKDRSAKIEYRIMDARGRITPMVNTEPNVHRVQTLYARLAIETMIYDDSSKNQFNKVPKLMLYIDKRQ